MKHLHVMCAQGFLTAVKQEVSRRHAADKWALDDVVLTAEVTHPARDVDGIKDAPAEGVFVYGLYLDGCAWSARENRLIDAEPKKLFNLLPVLYVTGVQVRWAQACALALANSTLWQVSELQCRWPTCAQWHGLSVTSSRRVAFCRSYWHV